MYLFIYLFNSIFWTFIPCAYAWSLEVFTFVQTNCGKKIQMSHRFGRTFIHAVYLWIRSTVSRGVKRWLLVCRGVFIALREISRLRWVCGEDAAGLACVSSGCFREGSSLFVDAVCVKGQTRKESQFHSVEKLQVRYDYDSWKVTSGSQWKLYFLLF